MPPEDRSYRLPASPAPGWIGLRLVLALFPFVGGGVAAALDKQLVTEALENSSTVIPLLLVYEAVVLMAGIWRKVWARLEPAVVDMLVGCVLGVAGALRTRLLNLLSRYRRHYLRQLLLEHRNCNVRGLRIQGAYALRLADVFVELRIAPNNAQRATLHLLGGTERSDHRSIWRFIQQTAKEEGQALAILGAPGSGKTTLLQSVALALAANQQRRHRVRAAVPLLLFLRNHVDDIAGERPLSLGALADRAFRGRPGLPPPPPGWFEEQLVRGESIVLLDGLDEAGDEDKRRRVAAWTDAQISAYPRSLFLLTARPMGYRTAPLERAHVLEVLPFGAEQVRRFVHNWYLANEIMRAGGQVDEGVRQMAEAQANDLLARLRSSPSLGDLTRNPLLVTMLATVHSQRNALPGGRVELYGEIADVLLGHWQRAKGIQQPLSVG
ncbi:NACHT domain-containing NTPase [Sorangium sp. So ce1667]